MKKSKCERSGSAPRFSTNIFSETAGRIIRSVLVLFRTCLPTLRQMQNKNAEHGSTAVRKFIFIAEAVELECSKLYLCYHRWKFKQRLNTLHFRLSSLPMHLLFTHVCVNLPCFFHSSMQTLGRGPFCLIHW